MKRVYPFSLHHYFCFDVVRWVYPSLLFTSSFLFRHEEGLPLLFASLFLFRRGEVGLSLLFVSLYPFQCSEEVNPSFLQRYSHFDKMRRSTHC